MRGSTPIIGMRTPCLGCGMNNTAVILCKDQKKSFIGAWMIKDDRICDDLIREVDESPFSYEGVITKGVGNFVEGQTVDKAAKDSIDCTVQVGTPNWIGYTEQLQDVLGCYKKRYESADAVDPYGLEAVNIQKYGKGGAYHAWHKERGCLSTATRHLAYMTYLNDVSDGGETEFLYQKLKVKPKKGLTLVWPVDWTHTHRGLPSMSQSKYIVTGWYRFMENNQ